MDREEIYRNWSSYPDCRIRIALYDDSGERCWGKILPDGTFGLNNLPLHSEYQWQDIVKTMEIRDEKALLFRRWNKKVYYWWPEPEEEKAAEIRDAILKSFKEAGLHPGFWCPGVGYALFREDLGVEKSREVLRDLLKKVGVENVSFEAPGQA